MIRMYAALAFTAISAFAVVSGPAHANSAIAGPTGVFEQDYLNFILDHHYVGRRTSELAVGTAVVGPTESAPYPGNPAAFPPSPAKATDALIFEMAPRSNATEKREIAEGQGFLQQWYGQTATLDVTPSGQVLIDTLTAAAPGNPFNIAYLNDVANHHIEAITRSIDCFFNAGHEALRTYCYNIIVDQTKDTREMRARLVDVYGITPTGPALPTFVAEPASMAILAGGVLGIGGLLGRRRRSTLRT